MKRYYAVLTLALLLTGCFKQDLSDCEVDLNFELRLFLLDGDGGNELKDKIFRVDVAIFDTNDRLVVRETATKADLDIFPGMRLDLAPGEYRVLCWGNIDASTQPVGNVGDRLEDLFLKTTSPATSSPLYYGPKRDVTEVNDFFTARSNTRGISGDDYTVVVKPNRKTVKDIYFTRAHRTVNIYIQGYEEIVESQTPGVNFTNQPRIYNFTLCTDKSRKNYDSRPAKVTTTQGEMLYTSFNTMMCGKDDLYDNMFINIIRASDGGIQTTVDIYDWVTDALDSINDINDITILIEYTRDGFVNITVNPWQDIPVDPVWPD